MTLISEDARPRSHSAETATLIAVPEPEKREHNIRTDKQCRTEQVHLVAVCVLHFLSGWTDGSLGPLIPSIQSFYGLSYTVVSLLFVFRSVGYLVGTSANILLTRKYGLGKMMLLGCSCHIIGNSLQSLALKAPFEVFVLGNFFTAIGLSINNSQMTGYLTVFTVSPQTKMGIYQSFFGLGCLVSPLVATQFAKLPRRGHWGFLYLVTLGLAIANAAMIALVFRGMKQEECLKRAGQMVNGQESEEKPHPDVPSSAVEMDTLARRKGFFHELISSKSLHLLALFLFVYVGTEVTISGWIVSFVMQVRGGGGASGYVASAFWGGYTIGRVALLPLDKRLGESLAIYVYTAACIGLQLIIWFVPSFVASAISVSFIGLLFGPMFVLGITQTAKILPPHLVNASIAWIDGFASVGAAIFPLRDWGDRGEGWVQESATVDDWDVGAYDGELVVCAAT
ncbi:MFS domain-containing protein [Mycena kentingensis (nom. inval.)]|nr:MFS domain-containing protein [Mycena kentingensis (nom. inval.)]